ncbi:MAG: hypothetical protein IKO93_00190, partial [Lentisphaeria bacterium]|nr:hypothetical protein [Lentisphaeria bacterium]
FLLDRLCGRVKEEKLLQVGRLTGLVLTVLAAAAVVVVLLPYPGLRPWAILPLLFSAAGLVLFLRRDLPLGSLLFLLTAATLLPYGEAVLPNRFSAEDNLESLFRRVDELESQGEKVYLADPMERLLGAATYYRGHLMPVRRRKDYDGRSREIWIFRKRDKKKTAPYGDHHYIVQMPEGKLL